MASAFSHAFSAWAIGKVLSAQKHGLKFWILGMLCAIIPDADVIGFYYGVPYHDMFGHRGFTHSFFFSAILGGLIPLLFYRRISIGSKAWWSLALYFFLCTASHALLDALTNGGLGVALFAPFDGYRYFFPFRPVLVSPIHAAAFFSEWGVRVILSELKWIWFPCGLAVMASYLIRLPSPLADREEETMDE